MTYHDPLTGLPNRPSPPEAAGPRPRRVRATDRPLALLLMTLDNYRDIANTLGHQNADLMVRDLVVRLGDVLGEGDRVARLRGDEFAVVLPAPTPRSPSRWESHPGPSSSPSWWRGCPSR